MVTKVILPLTSYLGFKLSKWLTTKTNNENIKEITLSINEIITSAVRSTFQTYVASLKESGKFDKNAQLEALNKAKTCILSNFDF